MCDPLEDIAWLYRGVPRESPEVEDVRAIAEVRPSRTDRRGEFWRQAHIAGDTETAYTSWTSNRSLAEAAAEDSSNGCGLSGEVIIFRIRVASLSHERVFPGRDDEDEWLIEGTIEEVAISESATDEEEDDYD